jgi:hypothetical protein
MIGTLTQGHELPVVAPAAILRCVGWWIDFDELSASFFRLLIKRQRLPILLIRFLAAGKQVIIEPATLFQGFVEPDNLLFCGENPILKHFKHSQILAQSSTDVNKQAIPIPSPIKGRALHPRHEWTGLSSPFTVKVCRACLV